MTGAAGRIGLQFMLDHLKQLLEIILRDAVCEETVEYLLEEADRNNAEQLREVDGTAVFDMDDGYLSGPPERVFEVAVDSWVFGFV